MNYAAYNTLVQMSEAEKAKMAQWAGVQLNPLIHTPQQIAEGAFWQEKARVLRAGLVEEKVNTDAMTVAHKSFARSAPEPATITPGQQVRQHYTQAQPAQPQKSAAQTAQLQQRLNRLEREVADLPGRVLRTLGTKPTTRSQAQPTAQAQAPQLAVSSVTGQPSQIATVIRAGMGLHTGQALNQHPYQVQQQAQRQAQQQKAESAGLPISPHTGRPSSLTAWARGSVGIGDTLQPGQVVYRGEGGSTLTYQPTTQPGQSPPISPHTGKPSRLTEWARRSVGIE